MKRQERSVPFNFVMNFLLKLSGAICTAISYPFAYRMIGETAMGRVAFSNSVASFFMILASLGITTYGVRECAKVRDDPEKLGKTAAELLMLQGLMALASELVLLAAVLTVPRLRENGRLFLIQGVMLLFHGLDSEWLFSALEEYGVLAARSLAVKFLSVALILAFVRKPEDYLLYCIFLVLSTVLRCVWNVLGARRYMGREAFRGKPEPLRHVRTSSVFFFEAMAATIYTNLDAVLLGFLKDDAAVGAYDAAVKIRLLLVYFITSLGGVLLPRFSYYLSEDRKDDFRKGLRLSMSFVWAAGLPLMLFFLVMGRDCLEVLYGTASAETLESLRLLMPTVVLIGCSNVVGIQLLTPMGKEKLVMASTLVGALADLGADMLLIPRMGASGAALGTLIAETAVLAVQLAGARRLEVRPVVWRSLVRVALVSVVAAAGLWLARRAELAGLVKVLAAAVLYFAVVYVTLLALKEPVMVYGAEKLRERIRKGNRVA